MLFLYFVFYVLIAFCDAVNVTSSNPPASNQNANYNATVISSKSDSGKTTTIPMAVENSAKHLVAKLAEPAVLSMGSSSSPSTHQSANKPSTEEDSSSDKSHSRKVTNTSVVLAPHPSDPKSSSVKSTVEPPSPSTAIKKNTSTSSTLAPTTTTTTTKPPSSTSTESPKKPRITFSIEDDSQLLTDAQKNEGKAGRISPGLASRNGLLSVEHPVADNLPNEPVMMQSSETISLTKQSDGRQFIFPMIALIFAVPLILIIGNNAVRCGRDYWSKRKYRRMDYLIDEMYN